MTSDYSSLYAQKNISAAAVAEQICSGWSCCTDIAASIPHAICGALAARAEAGKVTGVTLNTMLDLQPMDACRLDMHGNLMPVSWFSGGGLRNAINRGAADIMPCYYRDMPSLFDRYIDVDAYLAIVSPMDSHGYFSTGTTGSVGSVLLKKAKHIFLEVNPNMPRAVTATQIHISQVTALCESSAPLPVFPPAKLDETSMTIGNLIADEIPDGATFQLGIGAIPEAVGNLLKNKRHLGIHTELFTDSMVELLECGAADNSMKPLHRGHSVFTLAFGSQRMYDYINNNPTVELLPVSYVNDPAVIAQHPNFISVNSALEVDFFGQVCAESLGTKHISGSGGQADYVRGAICSPGGKSFMAFASTAANGTASRIRPTLTPGAIVSTSKNDVDCIVTEYGIARLRGRTLSQRAKALISVAHPKFRDELTFEAKRENIII